MVLRRALCSRYCQTATASAITLRATSTSAADEVVHRRALRCPGGNRMTSQGIKSVLKVSSSGQLKRIDQRFIINLKLTHQIMSNLSEHLEGHIGGDGKPDGVDNGKLILEIGPGPGALTRSLLTRQAAGVLGVEIDPRFNSYLEQIHQQTGGKFHWANADIMSSDEYTLIKEHFPSLIARMEGEEGNEVGAQKGGRVSNEFEEEEYDGSKASSSPRSDGTSTLRNGFHTPLKSLHRESILKRRQHMAFGTGLFSNTSKPKSNPEGNEEGGDEEDDFFSEPDSHKEKQQMKKELSEADKIKARWTSQAGSSLVVISNLPFQLATSLLMRYSFDSYNREGIYKFGRTPVYCLLQLEIANRLIALPPGTRVAHRKSKAAGKDSRVNDEKVLALAYGRPSVLFQNFFHIRVHRLFSEKTFYPPVDVLGAFVQLTPRAKPLVDIEPAALIAFLNTTFLGRLRGRAVGSALRQAMPAELASYALQQLRLDSAIPIGQLTVREVALLAKVWERYMLSTNQSMKDASDKARDEDIKAKHRAEGAEAEAEEGETDEDNVKVQPQDPEPEASSPSTASPADDEEDATINIMFDHLNLEDMGKPLTEADRFASMASTLDGDEEVIQEEGSIGNISRDGNGNVNYGVNPRDAFVNDAMDFFGLSEDSGSDKINKDELSAKLWSAKQSGKSEYLKFKEQTEDADSPKTRS